MNTHANACLDLYGDLFARSLISIARLAIGMVQGKTINRYLAILISRRTEKNIVHFAVKMETWYLAASSVHRGNVLVEQADSPGSSIF